jgi:small-conductance mechanosensitive channel
MKRRLRGAGSFLQGTEVSGVRRGRLARLHAVVAVCLLAASAADAQTPAAPALKVERANHGATLTFFNRDIVVFRARVAGREPAERAAAAERLLHELAVQGATAPIEAREVEGARAITIGSRHVFYVTSADPDDLAGETLDGVTGQTLSNLKQAFAEVEEAHAPASLLRSAALSLAAIALALVLLWGFARVRMRIVAALIALAERRIARVDASAQQALRVARVIEAERQVILAALTVVDLTVIYLLVTFVLRRFPYTREWGESMLDFLISTFGTLALKVVNALPGLFTVVVILAVARILTRVARAWFTAVEQGQVRPRWIHPETAQPTRRIALGLLWIFAAIVAYPYMPGSQTDAFKGVSVFLGLMVTFGSSGLVNQIMSGFMITYSRALRVGDFVRIGDAEGTVIQIGVLSTKIKSLWHEEVTIPNAVVVERTMTDYSRPGDVEGVFTPTTLTIGYDAPWRQVHALLLLAAARTPGLRAEPKPIVVQTALQDFYVKYTLLVCLERQQTRLHTMDTLHANIQDLFNEYGVQIMSPNYMIEPSKPKVVPKERWFAEPASPLSPGETRRPAAPGGRATPERT